MLVEPLQPVIGGAGVMPAAPAPVLLQSEQIAELAHQAVAWHQAAGEEVLADPIGGVGGVEAIGRAAVAEHVDEQGAVGLQPAAHARQKAAPVGHVLEHLHRHHPVEPAIGGEDVHVGGGDGEVGQPLRPGPRLDELALGGGVRNAEDAGVRVMLGHVEAERAPAASELQYLLAVLQVGVGAGLRQRQQFRLLKAFAARGIEAAGIFQVRPEHPLEKGGGELVMLIVGGGRVLGDRPGDHIGGEGGVGLTLARKVAPGAGDEGAHGGAAHCIRQGRALEHVDDGGDSVHAALSFGSTSLGGRGSSGLTRA